MKPLAEKKLLQIAIIAGCAVPLLAGGSGVLQGAGLLDGQGADLDSHFRYLSGLLLAIGLGFLSCVPRIEAQGARVRLLTFIVVVGGVARLYGSLTQGLPDLPMRLALGMELVITPALCLWQARLARRCA